MVKSIVFGGNGFVGSHLVDALVRAGHKVTCFDRFSDKIIRYEEQEVTQIIGDFMDQEIVGEALKGQDYVFHFISTTNPATAEDNPQFDVKTNIASSIGLFEECLRQDIQKVFFASTGGAIYGDQEKEIFNEQDQTLPFSPYAIGKLTIENYLRYFNKKFDLDYVILRISNPYGTRQQANRKQGVIPIFLRQVQEGKSITVYGDGMMVRDYIYVSDLVDMVVAVTEQEAKERIYNIGSGTGYSVNDIITCIEKVTGRGIVINQEPIPKTFVQHVTLDTVRYSDEFKIKPNISLEEGIRLTWEEMV